jgi:hypothetical protein
MVGDVGEPSRRIGEGPPPAGCRHRPGGRTPRGEGRCREPLGQPSERGDLDAGDSRTAAGAAGQVPPGDDAGHVVRREDGDRRHRSPRFACAITDASASRAAAP